ncbi:hypothetical protein C1645_834662 [Glomus cerebriforme]|uniref:Uncharacterized protein n=1 Tax=Glomus cerebriforme TaxID=658196 RepID=A0A397SBM5_9GLOM|nr:hypothetical protein C1645_834662 [Glomus cerebriforme]
MNKLKLVLPENVYFLEDKQKYGSMILIRKCYLALIELIEEERLLEEQKAYIFHFTSPKKERSNEAVKSLPGSTMYFMPIWDQEEIFPLWFEMYKDKKDNSINNDGLPKDDSISGKLVHLDACLDFTKISYHFATNELASYLIDEYERKNKRSISNFINNKTVITEKVIPERKNNFYSVPENILEGCYNRPRSKSNISIDSFVYEDDNTLDLYQITVSTNHGIKAQLGKGKKGTYLTPPPELENLMINPINIFCEVLPQHIVEVLKI